VTIAVCGVVGAGTPHDQPFPLWTLAVYTRPPEEVPVFSVSELECAAHVCRLTAGVWSLSDMAEQLRKLFNQRHDIDRLVEQLKRKYPLAGDALDEDDQSATKASIEQLRRFFELHGFILAATACLRAEEAVLVTSVQSLESRLQDVWNDFMRDTDTRHVEIIPIEKFRYYDAGFHYEVTQKFPEATKEIREAGTCYALGRNTACVFHLMRAVEYGMRELVMALGVQNPIIPLEYQVWNAIIEQIESRADDKVIAQWRDPAKANARAFFSTIISDLYAFKDDTRNVLMHTRSGGVYDAPRALSVMNRAQQFFERLVSKVEESDSRTLMDPARFN